VIAVSTNRALIDHNAFEGHYLPSDIAWLVANGILPELSYVAQKVQGWRPGNAVIYNPAEVE
jgi:hypothetical protein